MSFSPQYLDISGCIYVCVSIAIAVTNPHLTPHTSFQPGQCPPGTQARPPACASPGRGGGVGCRRLAKKLAPPLGFSRSTALPVDVTLS